MTSCVADTDHGDSTSAVAEVLVLSGKCSLNRETATFTDGKYLLQADTLLSTDSPDLDLSHLV